MNSMLPAVLLFSICTAFTHALNCVSCVGSTNAGCNDPYNAVTSGDIPVPYNTYCAKVVYPNYVERMAGGRSCTSGSGAGGSTIHCCSDKDYCNQMNRETSSVITVFVVVAISMMRSWANL